MRNWQIIHNCPRGMLTSEPKVVRRMCNLVEQRLGLRSRLGFHRLPWRLPSGVQELPEVERRQALRSVPAAGEMEDNGRFHWGEEGVAGTACTVVEEIRLVNSAVFGLRSSFTDDTNETSALGRVGTNGHTHRSIISISAWNEVTFVCEGV